MTKKAKTHNCV